MPQFNLCILPHSNTRIFIITFQTFVTLTTAVYELLMLLPKDEHAHPRRAARVICGGGGSSSDDGGAIFLRELKISPTPLVCTAGNKKKGKEVFMTMNRDQCLLCKSCIYFSGHIAKACTTHIRAQNKFSVLQCNTWILMVQDFSFGGLSTIRAAMKTSSFLPEQF